LLVKLFFLHVKDENFDSPVRFGQGRVEGHKFKINEWLLRTPRGL